MKERPFKIFVLFLAVGLFVLHPYTIYGKPGILVTILLCAYALRNGAGKLFFNDYIVPCIILLTIATIGVTSSVLHGIFQYNHVAVVFSFIFIILSCQGVAIFCKNNNISFNDILVILLMVLCTNSMIIIIELEYDALRIMIESVMVQFEEGSINYAYGYRFRGVASSGGAGLSVSIPSALIIALYLREKNKISTVSLLFIAFILVFSAIVIGRTGIIMSFLVFAAYLIFRAKLAFQIRDVAYFITMVSVTLIAVPWLLQFLTSFFTEAFDEAFVNYAFGFLLEGKEGVENEGTIPLVADFLLVLPFSFPEFFVGYGFYGGSNFYPWTDSGFARTFLSVGFIFGFAFYFVLYRIYLRDFAHNKFLIGSFVFLLTVAEIKEPLICSGVSSRIFLLILVFIRFERSQSHSATFKRRFEALMSSDA